jgi:hypothetical protein
MKDIGVSSPMTAEEYIRERLAPALAYFGRFILKTLFSWNRTQLPAVIAQLLCFQSVVLAALCFWYLLIKHVLSCFFNAMHL